MQMAMLYMKQKHLKLDQKIKPKSMLYISTHLKQRVSKVLWVFFFNGQVGKYKQTNKKMLSGKVEFSLKTLKRQRRTHKFQ